jgi:hypothetical protein
MDIDVLFQGVVTTKDGSKIRSSWFISPSKKCNLLRSRIRLDIMRKSFSRLARMRRQSMQKGGNVQTAALPGRDVDLRRGETAQYLIAHLSQKIIFILLFGIHATHAQGKAECGISTRSITKCLTSNDGAAIC